MCRSSQADQQKKLKLYDCWVQERNHYLDCNYDFLSLFLLNSFSSPPIFFLLPPFMTSEAVHSQVSLREACVSSHSLLFAWLSPLSTQYNSAIIRTVSNQESGRVRVTCSEKMMPTLQQKTSTRGGKKKLKSGEQSERERSRENGDGRLPGKLHRIWRFYRETRTKKGVMQHVCCLYGGSLNRLIAPSFSRLGCSNVSDHPNSSSVKYICISYIHSIDHWSGRKPLLQFHFYPKCFTFWKISDLRA